MEHKTSNYVIVKFQELPHTGIDPIQCVTNKWISRFEDGFVVTAFPSTNDADIIDELVEKNDRSRGEWSLYKAQVLDGKGLYKNAYKRLFELRTEHAPPKVEKKKRKLDETPDKQTMDFKNSKYVIVKFQELPHTEMDPIQCVPKEWINRFEDDFIITTFPSINDPDKIDELVEKANRSRGEWLLYKAHVLTGKGLYKNAYKRLFELRTEHARLKVEKKKRKLDETTDKQINELMNSRYLIVKFQELPHTGIDPIQCVPYKWISRFEDDFVVTAFPSTNDADIIDELVEKYDRSRGEWSLYKARILDGKAIYKNAIKRLFEIRSSK